MALPPLLKRRPPDIADTRPPQCPDPQGRTRARRRLIGASVLLVLGIIAFPVLFESQPRPVPVDIPIVIPPRDGAAPAGAPGRPGRVVSGTIGDAASEQAPAIAIASAPTLPPPAVATAPQAVLPPPVVLPAPPLESKKPEKPAERVAEKPTTKPANLPSDPPPNSPPNLPSKSPAKAPVAAPAPAPAATTTATTAPKNARYVIQVAAYADDVSAKEARARVERLGLKTFTQDVEVQGARRVRVRVGPFATQDEAAKALATLKAGKLPGVVLTL